MNERTKNNWMLAATMAVVILVSAGMVTAVVLGARGADTTGTLAVTASVVKTVAASASEEPAASVIEKTSLDMREQHQAMMDQMRASVSATMTNLMNSDPMWRTMRSSALIADLEKHEQEIDRMLASGS